MTTYLINHTDKTQPQISIQEANVDTSTDVVLFGRTRLSYGPDMNQNMLSLLEKFACPENPSVPGVPNIALSNGKLITPITGQFWYNSTQKIPFVWNGTRWVSLLSKGSMASNWGIISDGQQIPQPVGDDGHVFAYSECVWVVGPFTISQQIFDYDVEADVNAVVTAQFNGGQAMIASYFIVGIRDNDNLGTLAPVVTPTVTPTSSVTPSSTPPAINLNVGLISYWEFEEGGGATFFLDNVGTNNFTRSGAIGTTLAPPPPSDASHAKVGGAIRSGNTSFFEANPTSGMSAGANASYSFGGWFAINSNMVGFSNLFQRGVFGVPGQRSFTLTYTLSSDSLALYKSNDGTAYEFVLSKTNVGLDDFGWHFIVAWVDASTLTLNIQIDNGPIYSAAFTTLTTFNIGTLKLGSSTGIPLQSAVDQLFYYNRALNTAERTALWNGGVGLSAALAAGLITPTPTSTVTPTPTPPVTPTLSALTVQLSSHLAQGACSGVNCLALTNSVIGLVSGGVAPYTFQWIFVAGAIATINQPTAAQTTFQRSGSAQTLTGYYRLRVTDASSFVVYSSIVEVQTIHS